MAITGVNHVTLIVADVERSLGFYRDLLGGRLVARLPRGAYLELGALWLIVTHGEVTPREDRSHLALTCAAGDFDALAARIAAAAPLWLENRSEGASLYFLDPDGHRLELAAGTLATRLAHFRADPPAGVVLS